jgi:hypothetical protein
MDLAESLLICLADHVGQRHTANFCLDHRHHIHVIEDHQPVAPIPKGCRKVVVIAHARHLTIYPVKDSLPGAVLFLRDHAAGSSVRANHGSTAAAPQPPGIHDHLGGGE